MKKTRLSLRIKEFKYSSNSNFRLRNIDMHINEGEFISILGANGSGKTTLLKIMDGLIKEFEGEVLLDGENIRKLTPKQIYSKIGLLFQNPEEQLFASTVYEDVSFGPLNMGFSEEETRKRVLEALKILEMESLFDAPINALSYGQKKRIAIAGLLAMGHEILLLDEPTLGLDPAGEKNFMNLIKALNTEKGVTVVMTTHNVDIVPLYAERIYILHQGHIAYRGTPKEIFTSSKKMEELKLRLPYVSEVIYRMKTRNSECFETLPLTVDEAVEEMEKDCV